MNIDSYLTKQLKEKEEVIRVVRRYPMVLVPSVGLGVIMILADFFLIAWWMQHRVWGIWGFLAVLLLAIMIGLRGWYLWKMNILVVTNQRIIDINQHGLFQRTVAEASYDKIQDVRYTIKGVWQTLMTFGTIVVQTAGSTTTLELSNVKHPAELQQLIVDIQRESGKSPAGHGSLSAAELVNVIHRMKSQLPKEEWDRLVDHAEAKAEKQEEDDQVEDSA